MEAVELKIDERGRITIPAEVRKLLDWRRDDVVEAHLVEPTPNNVIADTLYLINLGRRERTSDKAVPLGVEVP